MTMRLLVYNQSLAGAVLPWSVVKLTVEHDFDQGLLDDPQRPTKLVVREAPRPFDPARDWMLDGRLSNPHRPYGPVLPPRQ